MTQLSLTLQTQQPAIDEAGNRTWRTTEQVQSLSADRVAIILCDVWNSHYCTAAVDRLEPMVPRMNQLLHTARDAGSVIIHAPSETMDFYEGALARQRALAVKPYDLPQEIEHDNPAMPIDGTPETSCDRPDCLMVKTFDRQHRGIDIDISSFRAMDEGVGIRAVVGGEVVDVYDGHFDRETSCDNDDWNAVFVESDDGYLMYYGHMRNGSMSVEVGDRVERGDTLGLVGSSGCSSGPHLHFEVWAGDVLIDPFQDGLWASPPVYDTPASLMAGLLEADGFLDFLDIQDPGDQATAIQLGQDLGFGVSMAGGEAGDRVLVEVSEPGGQIWETMSLTFDQTWRHSFWYWNRSPDRLGKWQAAFFVNGELSETHTFELE